MLYCHGASPWLHWVFLPDALARFLHVCVSAMRVVMLGGPLAAVNVDAHH
jgi:hypothetical protein